MAIPWPSRKWTYRDILRLPEDHHRHEILDGVHYQAPSRCVWHQRTQGAVFGWIWKYLQGNSVGEVVCARFDVRLSKHDIVVPDLLFISRARLSILKQRSVVGAPDLLIEVVSPDTRERDLGLKRERYELLGVGEYWVVSPGDGTVEVHRRAGSGEPFLPSRRLSAETGGHLATSLLPGLEIPLTEVFRNLLPGLD